VVRLSIQSQARSDVAGIQKSVLCYGRQPTTAPIPATCCCRHGQGPDYTSIQPTTHNLYTTLQASTRPKQSTHKANTNMHTHEEGAFPPLRAASAASPPAAVAPPRA
jgi:hypothetical protein